MMKMRIVLVLVLLLVFHCADATTFTVGDALNWVDPPTPMTYSVWASSNVFVIHDVLGNILFFFLFN